MGQEVNTCLVTDLGKAETDKGGGRVHPKGTGGKAGAAIGLVHHERGERQENPNHRLLTEIITVLGCSADYLLLGTQGYNERRSS